MKSAALPLLALAAAFVLLREDAEESDEPLLVPGERVRVAGDSVGVGILAALRAAGYDVTGQPRSGTTIEQWLGVGHEPYDYDVLIVSLGTNDAYASASYQTGTPARVLELWADLAEELPPGTRVVWVLPPGDAEERAEQLDDVRSEVFEALWTYAGPDRWAFQPDVELQGDRIHPTPAGYAQIVEQLERSGG